MIPKASQRGAGQDLATHLLNAFDNAHVEVVEVRGAVARDLHGAFAEWELQADALTRCRNYLYSLSVNPHPNHPLTRAQYDDYIARAEEALGLTGQPRAVVFHVKDGREHCHVVWSRIDTERERAVHQAFDRQALMVVTRRFARDHGITLPEGMEPGADRRAKPMTLYDRLQDQATGLSREERMHEITAAWRRSDSPRAFVNALADMGYVLATGDRPYVLIDAYGGVNALPRMIDDRSVRTKDIRAFLEQEFPPELLPDVEEARAQIARYRQVAEDFALAQAKAERGEKLKARQEARREKLAEERRGLAVRQARERGLLAQRQAEARHELKQDFLTETRAVHRQRQESQPTGLAAFLGRVTGMALIVRKVRRFRDRQRHEAYRERKAALQARQRQQADDLGRRHQMQLIELHRRAVALHKVEQREQRALETALKRQARTHARRHHEHMPSIALELRPRGRRDVAYKAKDRHTSELARDLARAASAEREKKRAIRLTEEFLRAAEDTDRGDEGRGDAAQGRIAPRARKPEGRPRGGGRRRTRRPGDGGTD